MDGLFQRLLHDAAIKDALLWIELENEHTLIDQIDMTAIPAPTFQEETRGRDYAQRLRDAGLTQVETDLPGIADNGRGLTAVLTLIKALEKTGIQTQGDILFGATVGMIQGGTSVNAIAEDASMFIDVRSTSTDDLASVSEKLFTMIHQAVSAENQRASLKPKNWTLIDTVVIQPQEYSSSPSNDTSLIYEQLMDIPKKINRLL